MNKNAELTEYSDYWIVSVEGWPITRICLDHALTFELWTSDDFLVIRIENPLLLRTANGELWLTLQEPSAVATIMRCLRQTVDTLRLDKSGMMELKLTGDLYLRVRPDEHYEAWEVSSRGGLRVVCGPGGDMAIWNRAEANEEQVHNR